MNLRGSDRLRALLLGAAAVGVFGPQQFVHAVDKFPAPGTSKKSTTVKVQTLATQPPALLPVSSESVIIPVGQTQTSGGKSEVQKQLELLYEQDGREMPDMNLDIQPVPMAGAPDGAANKNSPASPPANASGNTANGLRMQQPTPPATPPVAPPATPPDATAKPSKYPVVSFFKKMMPAAKEKTTPAPTGYRADVAPLPPETNYASQTARQPARLHPEYAPAQLPSSTQPNRSQGTANTSGSTLAQSASAGSQLPVLESRPQSPTIPAASKTVDVRLKLNPMAELPPGPAADNRIPSLQAAALPPLASQSTSLLPPGLPPLAAQSISLQPPALAQEQRLPPPLVDIPSSPMESPARPELSNPFTEMSESEADKRLEPFTGLTLEEDTGAKLPKSNSNPNSNVAKESSTARETHGAEDPFADELRKLGIIPPPVEPKTSVDTKEIPTKPAPNITTLPSESPSFDGIEDHATREKIKRIHERGSMKGLKGFCPVTLRDYRELVDAKPDYHSTYRGQKFHFADADAKLKFDEDAARYAPAAYGADVVALTRDKDVVEGTLDFAAWFKGRLYLFGTQEAHDTFDANPQLYATPLGIE